MRPGCWTGVGSGCCDNDPGGGTGLIMDLGVGSGRFSEYGQGVQKLDKMDDSGVLDKLDVLDGNMGENEPGLVAGPDSGPVLDLDKNEPGLAGENVVSWTVFWGPN